MTEKIGDLEIGIKVKIDDVTGAMDGIETAVNDAAKSAENLEKGLADAGKAGKKAGEETAKSWKETKKELTDTYREIDKVAKGLKSIGAELTKAITVPITGIFAGGIWAAFEEQGSEMRATIMGITEAMKEMAVSIGNALLPAVEAVRNIVQTLKGAWDSLTPSTQGLVVAIGAVAAAIPLAITAAGKLLSVYSSIGKAQLALVDLAPKVAAALSSMSGASLMASLTNPITLAVAGLAALTAAMIVIEQKTGAISAAFRVLQRYVDDALDSLGKYARQAGDLLDDLIRKLTGDLGGLKEVIQTLAYIASKIREDPLLNAIFSGFFPGSKQAAGFIMDVAEEMKNSTPEMIAYQEALKGAYTELQKMYNLPQTVPISMLTEELERFIAAHDGLDAAAAKLASLKGAYSELGSELDKVVKLAERQKTIDADLFGTELDLQESKQAFLSLLNQADEKSQTYYRLLIGSGTEAATLYAEQNKMLDKNGNLLEKYSSILKPINTAYKNWQGNQSKMNQLSKESALLVSDQTIAWADLNETLDRLGYEGPRDIESVTKYLGEMGLELASQITLVNRMKGEFEATCDAIAARWRKMEGELKPINTSVTITTNYHTNYTSSGTPGGSASGGMPGGMVYNYPSQSGGQWVPEDTYPYNNTWVPEDAWSGGGSGWVPEDVWRIDNTWVPEDVYPVENTWTIEDAWGQAGQQAGTGFVDNLAGAIFNGAVDVYNAGLEVANSLGKLFNFHSPAEEGPFSEYIKFGLYMSESLKEGEAQVKRQALALTSDIAGAMEEGIVEGADTSVWRMVPTQRQSRYGKISDELLEVVKEGFKAVLEAMKGISVSAGSAANACWMSAGVMGGMCGLGGGGAGALCGGFIPSTEQMRRNFGIDTLTEAVQDTNKKLQESIDTTTGKKPSGVPLDQVPEQYRSLPVPPGGYSESFSGAVYRPPAETGARAQPSERTGTMFVYPDGNMAIYDSLEGKAYAYRQDGTLVAVANVNSWEQWQAGQFSWQQVTMPAPETAAGPGAAGGAGGMGDVLSPLTVPSVTRTSQVAAQVQAMIAASLEGVQRPTGGGIVPAITIPGQQQTTVNNNYSLKFEKPSFSVDYGVNDVFNDIRRRGIAGGF